jgi:hypothetical protein
MNATDFEIVAGKVLPLLPPKNIILDNILSSLHLNKVPTKCVRKDEM